MKHSVMFLLIEFVLIFYLGECIGLYIQCGNFKGMNPVKPYVWLVPFLQIRLAGIIIKNSIEKKNISDIVKLYLIGHTSTMILTVLAHCIKESKSKSKSRSKTTYRSSYRRVYRTAAAALVGVTLAFSI